MLLTAELREGGRGASKPGCPSTSHKPLLERVCPVVKPYYFVSISLKPQVFKIIALSPNIPFLKKISALLRCT